MEAIYLFGFLAVAGFVGYIYVRYFYNNKDVSKHIGEKNTHIN